MTDKLVMMDEEEQKRHEKEFGDFNHLPPNFQEITEEEFAHSGFFTWCLDWHEDRQPNPPYDKLAAKLKVDAGTDLRLFCMNNTEGFGIGRDYDTKKIRYFKFQKCVHKFRRPTERDFKRGVPRPAHCFHVSVCRKCGYVEALDSSD